MQTLRAYKYRLYPTKKQTQKLQWTLDRARELYNAALQERRDAYEIKVKRHPNAHDEATRQQVAPLVERAAFVLSFNEAWLLLGLSFALTLLALPFLNGAPTRR